ncbi:hypothetical protein ACJIZ3_024538 [Penstemon smallii]|uniref:Uncharacterized protein n=1 Tax=Penstemon smallii TaxID=265156 RepID=A0ABD3TUN0_9LAMI
MWLEKIQPIYGLRIWQNREGWKAALSTSAIALGVILPSQIYREKAHNCTFNISRSVVGAQS